MADHEFTLVFELASVGEDPESHLKALEEQDCGDATVGIGRPGYIALSFSRRAESEDEAVGGAIKGVQRAIPTARMADVVVERDR